MAEPRGRSWTLRDKTSDLTMCLLVLVGGAVLVAVVLAAVDLDLAPIRALLAYTLYALALTVGLAALLLTTRSLPGVVEGTVDGEAARGLVAWPWTRRYDLGVDVGLVVLAGALTVLGVTTGDGWTVPALLVGAAGLWLLVRVLLAVAGPRRREAIWLTADHVVHDCVAGRVRVARSAVVDVRAGKAYVLVEHDGSAERRLSPRPWRREGRLDDRRLLVELAHLGATADDLVSWLRTELQLDAPRPAATADSHRNRSWRRR
jgi:hypothetical protein